MKKNFKFLISSHIPLSLITLLIFCSCSPEDVDISDKASAYKQRTAIAGGATNVTGTWAVNTLAIEANEKYEPMLAGEITESSILKIIDTGFIASFNFKPGGAIEKELLNDYDGNVFKFDITESTPVIGPGKFRYKIPFQYNEVYYRSYIKLQNGTVLLGPVKYHRMPSVQTYPALDGGIPGLFEGAISQTGSVPSVETGFVYSVKAYKTSTKFNPNPVYYPDPKCEFLLVKKSSSLSLGLFKRQFLTPYVEVWFRTYIKQADQTVVYGNTIHYVK
jgi:hypothetical protein